MPIKTIRHKGLKLFWTKGDASKIQSFNVRLIRRRMEFLDKAQTVDDLRSITALKYHKLTGNPRSAITITGNYRITFEWYEGDVYVLDLEDYH